MEEPYIVYVTTDGESRITAINSSAFILDAAGWTQIDEGFGDRFHHAQGNYLPEPLTDERGMYRYKLADGMVVRRTQEEMDADYANLPAPVPTQEERIAALEEENRKLKEALDALMGGIADA